MTLALFGAARSVFVRATRLALEEKGVAYTLHNAPPHAADVLAVNPFGKIPIMRHGGVSLFESLAIMIYADATFAGPKLFPNDAHRAALIIQWSSAVGATVFPALVGYMHANAFPAGPDGARDLRAIEELLPRVRTQIGILDTAIAATGYLAADTFTPADMYLLPILAYLRTFPESAEILARAKNLGPYFERHALRKSFRATEPEISAP